MTDVTREELLAALAEKEKPSTAVSDTLRIGKSFLGGGSAGAAGLLSIPLEVVNAPNTILNYLAGVNEPTATQKIFESPFVPKQPQGGPDEFAYNFGEGFIPAASLTYSATRDPRLAAGAGLLSGTTNVAAKYYFPESPVGQMAFSMLPGSFAGALNWARNKVPKVSKPTTLEETNLTVTGGQRAGSEKLLRSEAAIASETEAAPIFKQVGLANVQNAEDFASKIQNFAKNPNLTTEQTAKATIDAVNYHNNRIINKFRVDNRRNFNAAQQEAGDSRIFNTDNVNRVLDEQINAYSQPGQPLEYQSYAAKLKQIKDNLSQKAEPSMVLGPDGKPAYVVPEQNQPLTIKELQTNLESWGKAAKTGQYNFGGTQLGDMTPGSMKKLSRDILNAFKDDLDSANLTNVPGANKLIAARENYKTGLKDVNDFQNQTFVKYFGKESFDATDVVNYLKSGVTPTERVTMYKILENSKPEVLDTIRARTMQDIVQSSKGNLDDLFKNMKGILDEKVEGGAISTKELLFPTKGELAKAQQLTKDLEVVTRRATGEIPDSRAVSRVTGEVAGAGLGFKARMIVNTADDLFNLISSSTANPEKMAWMLTNPQGQSLIRQAAALKTGQKLPSQMQSKAEYLASDVLAGGVASATNLGAAREQTPQQQPAPVEITQEQLQQRLKELEGQQ